MSEPTEPTGPNVVQLRKPAIAPSVIEGQLLGAVLACGSGKREDLGTPLQLIDLAGISESEMQDRRTGHCWEIARQLAERGREVSAFTVFAVAKTGGKLVDADSEWIHSIESECILSGEAFGLNAQKLRQSILGRSMAFQLDSLSRLLRSGNYIPGPVAADLDSIREQLVRSDIRGETAASDVVELESKWDHREKSNTSPIIPSRIRLLDECFGGGFQPKLTVVAGQPGVGKNMFLAGMIRAQLEADPQLRIGLFALEDGSRWLLKRWVAQELGMPLPEVGIKKRTDEQLAKLEQLNPYFHKLLERVHVYRYRKIRPAELLHVSRGWIAEHGVGEILVDNLTHLDHTPLEIPGKRTWVRHQPNEQVAHAIESFAELADRKEIAIVALAHTVRPESERQEERPPKIYEVAGSSNIERVIRCFLGLWRTKGRELRLTIGKNNEGPGVGTTLELERVTEAATIIPSGGRQVNLDQEAREAREARETEKDDRLDAKRKKRADKRAAEVAQRAAAEEAAKPAPKPEPPQLSLVPVPSTPDEPRPG